MKKLLLTSFAAAFMLQAKAQSFSHAPVPVTGFTADVIADGPGSAANSTTADVDGGNYNFVAQNFVNPSGQSPTSYLPASGFINSLLTPGLPFQLAPYTGNNSLRLTTTTSSGTLTFTTPRVADKITLLATSANPSTFTAKVNFTDGTNQSFTYGEANWFDGPNPAVQGISRVLRTTNAIENSATNPRMYQYELVISPANAAKTIQSVTITKVSPVANEILHVFAVTASKTYPNDGGISSITSPTSPVAPNVSQPVTVTVKNYGSSPLSSATLGFKVNGTTVVNNFAFTASPALASSAVSAPVSIGNFSFPAGNHKIKAWTKLPNGVADGGALNDTVELNLMACNALSGNFTINKKSPATTTNFQSFAMAVQAMTTCGVGGPVTFTVAPNSGPYNEQITLPEFSGTSATNTVTFEGNGNTLTAATTIANPGVITFNGADYVKVNNFKINVDATAPAGWGVRLFNVSDNDIISNCTINVPLTSTSDVFEGIIASSGLGIAPIVHPVGIFANNLLIQNNTINGGYYGILINGNGINSIPTLTTKDNRIIGNQVRDPHSYGICINNGGTGTIIEGNDISRPSRTNGTNLNGIYLSGATMNTIISKNRIHNSHDNATTTASTVYGIYTLASATPGNENIIKNNLIYNINNPSGTFYGLWNNGGNGTYYYHNTISADDPAVSYSGLRGMYFIGTPTNVKFINNILSLSSSGSVKYGIYVSSTGMSLVSNNNDLYIGTTGKVGYFGADKLTLANWKTANTNAYDQNSISVDPVFVNPKNNLRPLVTALNNGGQSLASVLDDINGTTRSTTTPDMGALEFTPAANDAGVTAIISPTVAIAPGSQPVTVTLKNFGTAALTTAAIKWSVNGTLQPNFSWTGTLASLASTTPPVNIGTYNFPLGIHTLKVWSQSPNGAADGITDNDTTILRITSCVQLAGSYTINKNTPTSGTNFHSILEAVQVLNSCGVSAPVTFTVASGTGPYNEQVEIGNIPNASATNTVTFEGSGNTVSVTPGFRPGIFVLNGAKFVKLNNFVITLPATATKGWGVQLINAADNNTISNNTINLPLTVIGDAVNGIVAGTAVLTNGNNTNNTKIQNNIINGGGIGILINGNSGGLNASNNQITGNQIKDMDSYGVQIINANGTLVEGNDISRPTRTDNFTFYGVYLTGTCLNTIISKNRIHNTNDAQPNWAYPAYGVYIGSSATVGNENIVKNNLIYNINNPTGNFYGFYNGGNGAWYYHNTVLSNLSNPYTSYNILRGIHFTAASTNVKFINNVISLPNAATTKHAIYLSDPAISLVSNNNDLYIGSTGNTGYSTNDQATLAAWQAVNSNAYDQNSVAADPLFAAPATGNLKPTALTIAFDNLGQPVTAVTDDILGAARNVTTPDMGAYEFGTSGFQPYDAGIIAISGPNLTACSLSATDSITVTIKNYGTNTLTSIPVTYSIDGVAIATPETFTSSLALNATATFTFATKANLASPGTHVIVAKTLLSGDVVTSNDNDTLTVTNSLIPSMPAALDFETPATGVSRFRKNERSHSNITESTVASNGPGSTKGLILDGVDNPTWVSPTSSANPWTNNPDNFGAAYICLNPTGGLATDSLILTFDLKQLFKSANVNTNFRVTVNGTQVGPTYLPPFTGTPIVWQKVRVNLTPYKNNANITIGLESSVKEAYAAGAGTANLIDNIEIKRVAGPTAPSGVKNDLLQSLVNVYPNPSNGIFNVELPKGKTYELTVTDLTGKALKKQTAKGGNSQLNLEGTAQGIYLLKISGDNGIAVRKLIVE